MAKSLDHRLGEQIASYADLNVDLPDYVKAVSSRIKSVGTLHGPTTHTERMNQSKRGAHNPGPGKANKKFGRDK